LFYEFSLDRHVPEKHLLRSIDRFVELKGLRRELAPFYSAIGRPSIDPELMIRMLIVVYCFGIRSERRLCEEVHLNLAYRWFRRLGLTVRCRITRLGGGDRSIRLKRTASGTAHTPRQPSHKEIAPKCDLPHIPSKLLCICSRANPWRVRDGFTVRFVAITFDGTAK
jgi:hypothetical protein